MEKQDGFPKFNVLLLYTEPVYLRESSQEL